MKFQDLSATEWVKISAALSIVLSVLTAFLLVMGWSYWGYAALVLTALAVYCWLDEGNSWL